MPPGLIDAIAPLIAMVGVGTFTLLGVRMLFAYKAKKLEIERGGGSSERVEELMGDLRNEMHALRGEVGELQERLDFAERLLTRGQGGVEEG
jgi:hypothetical protein